MECQLSPSTKQKPDGLDSDMFLQVPAYAEAWDCLPGKIRILLNEDVVPLHRVRSILVQVEVEGEDAVYERLSDEMAADADRSQRIYEMEIAEEMAG